MKIPFVDLYAQYISIKSEIDEAIASVIQDTAFIKGKYVSGFEKSFKEAYQTAHCLGVGNGTDAIFVVLKSLGIGPTDEVITVANSWISTSETISLTGAKPVFVDIDPDYYTIDTDKIEEKITSNTKAILPVHLFGLPANLHEITLLCKKYDLHLVEDCAQAHFAKYRNEIVGNYGIAGTFSFFPGKNLGAYGDAGGIITNDDDLAEKVRRFANHGAIVKHEHAFEGINSRLDGMQAAILSVKLNHIHNWTAQRQEIAALYDRKIGEDPAIRIPRIAPHAEHVYHLYVVRVDNRQEVVKRLSEAGISTGVHYPTALPLLPAYSHLGYTPEDYPIASDYQNKILSLPIYPEMTEEQVDYVVNNLVEAVHST